MPVPSSHLWIWMVPLRGPIPMLRLSGASERLILTIIQVGGGIWDMETIERYLGLGINYVILGTRAVEDPRSLTKQVVSSRIKLSSGWMRKRARSLSRVERVTTKRLWVAMRFERSGVAGIVYTDIDRDGKGEPTSMRPWRWRRGRYPDYRFGRNPHVG